MKKHYSIALIFIVTAVAQEVTPIELGPRAPMGATPLAPRGGTQPMPGGTVGGTVGSAGVATQVQPQVIYQQAAPVIVDGKKVTDMTEDEMKDFLEKKIQSIYQDEDTVEFLRVAPGYGLTVTFDQPVADVIIGDKNLVAYTLKGSILELAAHLRSGDTTMKLVFSDKKILNYHIFIAPNFVDAQSLIKVSTSDTADGSSSASTSERGPFMTADNDLDLGAIAKVIENYDAMVQEKELSTKSVRRLAIFKKSDITSFQVYYIYLFKGGPVAMSFAYTNSFSYPIRYDESKLRIQVGSMQFIPDYVSFHETSLQPGQTTTGYIVLAHPPFSFKQPFELIWK